MPCPTGGKPGTFPAYLEFSPHCNSGLGEGFGGRRVKQGMTEESSDRPTLIEEVSPRLYATPLAAWPRVSGFSDYAAFVLNREAARVSYIAGKLSLSAT